MEAVAGTFTTFSEKLERIAKRRGVTKSSIAEACGVTPGAVQDYFTGSMPRAFIGMLLADFLQVDPFWLFDESEPWRDDFPENPASSLSDDAVMLEAARRYLKAERRLDGIITEAEKIDWKAVGAQLEHGTRENYRTEDGLPRARKRRVVQAKSEARLAPALEVAKSLYPLVMSTIDQFDSVRYATNQLGERTPLAGEPNNERRAHFHTRIQRIYDAIGGSNMLRVLEGYVFQVDNSEAAFEQAEAALKAYNTAK